MHDSVVYREFYHQYHQAWPLCGLFCLGIFVSFECESWFFCDFCKISHRTKNFLEKYFGASNNFDVWFFLDSFFDRIFRIICVNHFLSLWWRVIQNFFFKIIFRIKILCEYCVNFWKPNLTFLKFSYNFRVLYRSIKIFYLINNFLLW